MYWEQDLIKYLESESSDKLYLDGATPLEVGILLEELGYECVHYISGVSTVVKYFKKDSVEFELCIDVDCFIVYIRRVN